MNSDIQELCKHLKKHGSQDSLEKIKSLARRAGIGPILLSEKEVSEGLQYHIDNNIPLSEPIFRHFSSEYFNLLKEARELFESGDLIVSADSEWLLEGNIGSFAEYEGTMVPLDTPMELVEEDSILKSAAEYKGKKVNIGKPRLLRKGDPGYGRKQYVVYVKDKGKVKRITFGDPNLRAKPSNSKARKSFRARHKCDQKKDKTKPGYWACRYPPNW